MRARDIVTTALADAKIDFELLPHPRTERALAEAQALGVPSEEVAKTLVLRTPDGFLRAVVPASERLDLRKVRGVVGGGKRTHLATEEDLRREYPEFELGAVPPFAGSRSDLVLLDARLAARESVVVEAGVHDASIRLLTSDLLRLAGNAQVADLCHEEEGAERE
jgi:Ala-tRNA(Pro) deacylase